MEAGLTTADGGGEEVDLEGEAVGEVVDSEVGGGEEGLAEGGGDFNGAAKRRNTRRTLTLGGVEERVQELQAIMGIGLWWSIKMCIIRW